MTIDDDLEGMDRVALIEEAKRLRAGIRKHRDATEHDLCWHHPNLWSLLPEPTPPRIVVPDWPQFFRGCVHYRQSLETQAPEAPRITREYGEQ